SADEFEGAAGCDGGGGRRAQGRATSEDRQCEVLPYRRAEIPLQEHALRARRRRQCLLREAQPGKARGRACTAADRDRLGRTAASKQAGTGGGKYGWCRRSG